MSEFLARTLPIFDVLGSLKPYQGIYDLRFVALSVGVAVLSAFVALSVADHIATATRRRAKLTWTFLGAIVMGSGIWAMHFIGMLAFALPCGIGYEPIVTVLSIIPGILASGVALHVLSQRDQLSQKHLLGCAVLMGGGIGAMHYAGMAAMRTEALLRYDPKIVLLSVVVAVALAYLALVIRSRLNRFRGPDVVKNLVPAAVVGGAIAGMHYTAMEASIFYPLAGVQISGTIYSFNTLAAAIAVVTVLVALCMLAVTFALRQRELADSLLVEVSLREQSEQKARSERARLQAVFDAAVDAIVTIGRDGHILQWSAGAERMFGYAPDEIIGQNLTRLMPEPHRSRHAQYVGAYLETANAKIIGIGRELAAVRKDGSEFPMELAVSEVRVDGEIFFTGIMRDITERKRAQEDLIRAREDAEAANAAKSQFLATMSHEIRTPLNGVIGMANLLSSTSLDARQSRLVGNLARSGQALLAIINDILDFSKIEAGHLELFDVEFDPREIIAEVTDLFCERCVAKGLELVYFVAEDVPERMRGDSGRVRQILVNLVGNAVKFTEQGEILIELAVAESGKNEVLLSFAVEDTGIGIAPEKCPQVFESFRQVDDSMTRSRGGTGLGLAISRQLVELMGGTIGVESEIGRGSRFHFTLRCKCSSESTEPRPARQLERSLRTLAVDTNAVSARVLSAYLTLWGLDATFAKTVEEAEAVWESAAAKGNGFDVVILDIKGLAEAGIELGRKIRADRRGTPAEIALLIGMDRFVADKSLETVDAIATLTKPIRPSELFNSLAAVASGSHKDGRAPFYVRRAARVEMPYFKARILLAEDNPVNQEVATGILKNMGCQVVTAPNGAVAARLPAAEKFDLILMDCEMPELDGFEATKRIRQIEKLAGEREGGAGQCARTPIIALTAHALASVRQKCLAAGMDDFLTKPFDEMQITAALRRWIGSLEGVPAEAEHTCAPQYDGPLASQITPEDFAIDRETLDSVSAFKGAGGQALLKRVVSRFVDTAPGLAVSLRQKCDEENLEDLWRVAHSLKSSAAALGAKRLSKCCGEIETLAREGGAAHLPALLISLDAELASALRGLTVIVGECDEPVALRG